MPYLTRYILRFRIGSYLLLVNTISGAVNLVKGKNANIIESLTPGSKVSLAKPLETQLSTQGYLIDSSEDERSQIVRFLNLSNHLTKLPPSIYFALTYQCNLRCTYCNEWNIPNETKQTFKVLSKEQIDSAFITINKLEKLHQEQWGFPLTINLYGGEPLMQITREIVEYILLKSVESGFYVQIISNGINVPIFIDLFLKYRNIIRRTLITLDGVRYIHNFRRKYPSGHGTFDKVVQAIDLLLEIGIPVTMQTILDKQNISHLPALVQFAKKKGWLDNTLFNGALGKVMYPMCNPTNNQYKYFIDNDEFIRYIAPIQKNCTELKGFDAPIGKLNGYSFLQQLINEPNKIESPMSLGCDATRGGIYLFGPDNLIFPCVETAGFSQYSIGRYHPDLELWTEELICWQERHPKNVKKCQECIYLTICGGGCAISGIRKGNTSSNPDCPDIEKVLKAYIESNESQIIEAFRKAGANHESTS